MNQKDINQYNNSYHAIERSRQVRMKDSPSWTNSNLKESLNQKNYLNNYSQESSSRTDEINRINGINETGGNKIYFNRPSNKLSNNGYNDIIVKEPNIENFSNNSQKIIKYNESEDAMECPVCSKFVNSLRTHLGGSSFSSECGKKYQQFMFDNEEDYKPQNKNYNNKEKYYYVNDRNSSPKENKSNKIKESSPSEFVEINNKSNRQDEQDKSTFELIDQTFKIHIRNGTRIESYIAASERSQYSFGGKFACTTISMEAAYYFLHHEEKGFYPMLITKVDDILKTGSLLDPQQGYMSFSQLYKSISRFNKNLKEIHKIQDIATKKSFNDSIEILKQYSNKMKSRVCAIITKPPQTIMIGTILSKNNTVIGFFAFDSHPRETDSIYHGAQYILMEESDNILKYLTEWMFPEKVSKTQVQNSMFDMTFVILKENSKWKQFDIEDNEELVSPGKASSKMQLENSKLQMQLQEKTAQLIELQEKYNLLLQDNNNLKEKIQKYDDRNEFIQSNLKKLLDASQSTI